MSGVNLGKCQDQGAREGALVALNFLQSMGYALRETAMGLEG